MIEKETDKVKILDYFISQLSSGKDNLDVVEKIIQFLELQHRSTKKELVRVEKELILIEELLDVCRDLGQETISTKYQKKKSSTNNVGVPVVKFVFGDVDDYRTKDYWRKYAIESLSKLEMFVTSKEIMDSADIPGDERRACMSILSIVLSELEENGEIIKFKVEGEKGYYYGLPTTPLNKMSK